MIPNLALAVVGAALVGLPAVWFRIDRVSCDNWPPLAVGLVCAGVFAAGVVLLTVAWVRIALSAHRPGPSVPQVMLAGALSILWYLVRFYEWAERRFFKKLPPASD